MSGFLSPDELMSMRVEADRTLLDQTCTLLSRTETTNAVGETTVTWGTIGADVPCRLRPKGSSSLIAQALQQKTVADWSLTLPYGTVVAPGSRAVVELVTYEIMQSWDEEVWKTASRADVKRVE